ncbi:hypothetical protein [Crenothrix sp.]|uniref:hypothetical protein n=1 Tax=Crenothrix sp. TaxID=3100433 RepID=UPI00374CF914
MSNDFPENPNQKNEDDSNDNVNTKVVVIIVGIIVLIVVSFYFFKFHYGLSDKNEVWGTFGDYFGGILNPVIAAFAFYLIAKTYELQKRELEETRKLLKVSSDAQEKQVKVAALTALMSANTAMISIFQAEKLRSIEIPFDMLDIIDDVNNRFLFKNIYDKNNVEDFINHQMKTDKYKKNNNESVKEAILASVNLNLYVLEHDNFKKQLINILKNAGS